MERRIYQAEYTNTLDGLSSKLADFEENIPMTPSSSSSSKAPTFLPCPNRENVQYVLPLFDESLPRESFLPRCIRLAKSNYCKCIILFDGINDWDELLLSADKSQLTLGDVHLDINLKSEQRDSSGHTVLTWLSIPDTLINTIDENNNDDNNPNTTEEDIPSFPAGQNDYLLALIRYDDWNNNSKNIPTNESFQGFYTFYQKVMNQLMIAACDEYDVNILICDIGARSNQANHLWGIGPRSGSLILLDIASADYNKYTKKLELDNKEYNNDSKENSGNNSSSSSSKDVELQLINEKAAIAAQAHAANLAESRAKSNELLNQRLANRRSSTSSSSSSAAAVEEVVISSSSPLMPPLPPSKDDNDMLSTLPSPPKFKIKNDKNSESKEDKKDDENDDNDNYDDDDAIVPISKKFSLQNSLIHILRYCSSLLPTSQQYCEISELFQKLKDEHIYY